MPYSRCARVRRIGTAGSGLTVSVYTPSQGYTRHHVKGVDYPAIVPAADGTDIIGRTLSKEEASVRGTIVNGLSAADIRFLDTFEGDVSLH